MIGGLLMEDGGEADDKIVAVLKDDAIWNDARDISEIPPKIVERIQHYFLTYKMSPGEKENKVKVHEVYGVEHARKVVEASIADYNELYGKQMEHYLHHTVASPTREMLEK